MNNNNLHIIKITDYSITFNNNLTMSSSHEQDCCEHHYLDFKHITLEDVKNLKFDLSNDNFFNKIEGYGIELLSTNNFPLRIPGYGYNNGYYGTNIELELSDGRSFDVTECQDITD